VRFNEYCDVSRPQRSSGLTRGTSTVPSLVHRKCAVDGGKCEEKLTVLAGGDASDKVAGCNQVSPRSTTCGIEMVSMLQLLPRVTLTSSADRPQTDTCHLDLLR